MDGYSGKILYFSNRLYRERSYAYSVLCFTDLSLKKTGKLEKRNLIEKGKRRLQLLKVIINLDAFHLLRTHALKRR